MDSYFKFFHQNTVRSTIYFMLCAVLLVFVFVLPNIEYTNTHYFKYEDRFFYVVLTLLWVLLVFRGLKLSKFTLYAILGLYIVIVTWMLISYAKSGDYDRLLKKYEGPEYIFKGEKFNFKYDSLSSCLVSLNKLNESIESVGGVIPYKLDNAKVSLWESTLTLTKGDRLVSFDYLYKYGDDILNGIKSYNFIVKSLKKAIYNYRSDSNVFNYSLYKNKDDLTNNKEFLQLQDQLLNLEKEVNNLKLISSYFKGSVDDNSDFKYYAGYAVTAFLWFSHILFVIANIALFILVKDISKQRSA